MSETAEIQRLPEPRAVNWDNEAVARQKFLEDSLIRLVTPFVPKVPEQLLLGSVRDGRLRVNAPILVKCTRENQDIVAEAVELNEFGFGDNISEALSDLQAAIVELYFTLDQEQDRLGPDLQRTWATLQEKISRRP